MISVVLIKHSLKLVMRSPSHRSDLYLMHLLSPQLMLRLHLPQLGHELSPHQGLNPTDFPPHRVDLIRYQVCQTLEGRFHVSHLVADGLTLVQ